MIAVHLPATLPAFWAWLIAHWPTAPHGCRFEFGHGQIAHWLTVCR